MKHTQQGDIILILSTDNGDITISSGVAAMDGGLITMATLCLFGGNDGDLVQESTKNLQWWANFNEQNESNRLRSKTASLLADLPATSGNLRDIERAVEYDLAVFTREEIADSVTVSAYLEAADRVMIDVAIVYNGSVYRQQYHVNWEQSV